MLMRLAGVVIFEAILPLAVCAEIDPVALLNQARARIVEDSKRLPKYTCVQSVHRSRFDALPAVHVSDCGYVQDPRIEPRLKLAWRDRFKVDVTIFQGKEIFSWVGAQSFQSEDVDQIVGGGVTGTGDFGPFLISIFTGNWAGYPYLGLEQDQERVLAVYRYRVPLTASHYHVKARPWLQGQATAYEGKFWIDPENAELSRLTIEVSNPPREAQMCLAETTIDYRRVRIGGSDFLLPQSTILKMWDVEAQRSENRTDYGACREFQTQSVFQVGPGPLASESAAPRTQVAIPPGLTIRIALRSTIDSESSFAGEAIEGQLRNALRDPKGGLLAPAGTVVHGRIVRLEQTYHQPSNRFALGLKFDSINLNGIEVPLMLVPAIRFTGYSRLPVPLEEREGVGTFVFPNHRLRLDRKFISEWTTGDAKHPY